MTTKKGGYGSYDRESSDEDVGARDVEKIQTLWKDIRGNKKQFENLKTNKGVDYLGKGEQQTSLQRENNQLKEQIRALEDQLNSAKESNKLLNNKLKDSEEEIEQCHSKIAKQININSMQTNQINQMATKFETVHHSHKDVADRTRDSNQVLLRELEDKTNEIEKLKALIGDRTDKLSVVSVSYDQHNKRVFQLESDVSTKEKQIKTLAEKLDQAEKRINDLTFTRLSEGSSLLEVDHLRGDIKRLIQMLRSTQEYKDFADFADDGGSIRFLADIKRKAPLDLGQKRGSASPSGIRRLCEMIGDATIPEPDKWVPWDAFKFIQDFRRNYNGEITDTLLEKMLFELNRIWGRRETARLNRLKNQYSAEIKRLERKIGHHPGYKEVQSKQTITRLRNEVKTAHKENRSAFAERMDKNPPGIHYVSETFKLSNQNVRNKRELKAENDYLREKITKEATGKRLSQDQVHIIEKEFAKFKIKLQEIFDEFSKKKKEILELYDGNPDISLLLRKEDWFLENLETALTDFNKVLEIKPTRAASRKELNRPLTNTQVNRA